MKSTLRFATVVAVLLAFAVLAFSQQPSPALLNVTRIQVRGDRIPEFVELNRQVAEVIKKAAPADFFAVTYRTAVGNGNEFWRITPMNKFADRDERSPLYKMATPRQLTAWMARSSQYVVRSMTTIERPIHDLDVRASGAKMPPTFMTFYHTRVKPGMGDQFINLLKTDIMPAIQKTNGSMLVRRIELGGNTNAFTAAFPFEKWAEMDDDTAFVKAMGGEEAIRKFGEKMSQIEAGTEIIVARYVPELSYVPASTATPSR